MFAVVAIVSATPPATATVEPAGPPCAAAFPEVHTMFEILPVSGDRQINDLVAAPPAVPGAPATPPSPPVPGRMYKISGNSDACRVSFTNPPFAPPLPPLLFPEASSLPPPPPAPAPTTKKLTVLAPLGFIQVCQVPPFSNICVLLVLF